MRQTLNRSRPFPHRPRRFRAYSGGEILPVTFPSSPLTTKVWVALGADLTASRFTWSWLDITDHVRHDLGINLEVGRRNEAGRVTASRAQLKLANPGGIFSRRNPMSPYYGLLGGKNANVPIWIELDPGDGYRTMYEGYINDLPTRWTDASGTDSYVVIQCAGIMRRLEQGENLKSAMYRSMSGIISGDIVPIEYWPLEDGSDAPAFVSAVGGGLGTGLATATGDPDGRPVPAGGSAIAGSARSVVLPSGTYISFPVRPYTDAGQFTTQAAFVLDAIDSEALLSVALTNNAEIIAEVQSLGDDLVLELSAFYLADSFSDFVVLSGDSMVGQLMSLTITLVDNGSDEDIIARVYDGSGVLRAEMTTVGPNLYANVRNIYVQNSYDSAEENTEVGHVTLFADATFDPDVDVISGARAASGWTGEQAHERAGRLCREEGVPFTTQAADSASMGPQPISTLLEALRDCEKADGGVLYERGYGLAYQALSERYNQPVVLDLDFDQRHIYGTPEPADDDQRFRNQWTIRRTSGSTATVRDPGYAVTDGLYDDGDTVNIETDDQLPFHAGWRVRRDTVDEDRWPRLPINLGGTPDLIPGWLATPLGGRINVANPPAEMSPTTIDAIIEGYTQQWDTVRWTASLNTSPASIYQVGIAGDSSSPGTWAQTSDAVAAEEVDTTETSIDMTSTEDWTNASPGGQPLVIAGEIVALTAVSGSAPSWTLTVTRSVNNVVKSHPAGTPIRVWRPAVAVY